MRLTEDEQKSIREVFRAFSKAAPAELYLYGSRADDRKRGGDIDLLILVDDEGRRDHLRNEKTKILVELKTRIGDQKIDLTIETKTNAQTDPFIKSILPNAIRMDSTTKA